MILLLLLGFATAGSSGTCVVIKIVLPIVFGGLAVFVAAVVIISCLCYFHRKKKKGTYN